MSQFQRLIRISELITHRGAVSKQELLDDLEVSRATLTRDLDRLRSQAHAPIIFDADLGKYRFTNPGIGPRHQLPGLWFSDQELHALLAARALFGDLDASGGLGLQVQPLLDRIHELLTSNGREPVALLERVQVTTAARRPVPERVFEQVCEALATRRRLRLRYLTRGRAVRTRRDLSPQRLTWSRNTWYLDAWCHRRDRLQRFSLDAMDEIEMLAEAALDLDPADLGARLDAGYGAFAGGEVEHVVLRFSPEVAPWVSRERWHPEQKGSLDEDGGYRLRVPYVDPTELAMDVMRHGDQVVIEHDSGSLQALVRERTRRAWEQMATRPPESSPQSSPAPVPSPAASVSANRRRDTTRPRDAGTRSPGRR